MDILVAERAFIGHEALRANGQQVIARADIRRNLGALADACAHEAIPGPHVNRRIERGEGVERHFRAQIDDPLAQIKPGMQRIGAGLQPARHQGPAYEDDEGNRE
ncbi:MAG: hypothetical protein ACK56F_13250, partial [bacterium]